MKNKLASIETLAIVAVIALSSWHVGHYLAQFDGAIMAAVLGAVLGVANALTAYRFVENKSQRFAAGIGVLFFASASIWLQRSFYIDRGAVGLDALLLGAWAPVAELLLGWLKAKTNHAHEAQHEAQAVEVERRKFANLQAQLQAATAELADSRTTARRQAQMIAQLEAREPQAQPQPAAIAEPQQEPQEAQLTDTQRHNIELVRKAAKKSPFRTWAELAQAIDKSETSARNYGKLALQHGAIRQNGEGYTAGEWSR